MYIRIPVPIILTKCLFIARGTVSESAPSKFRIYGSHDGDLWVSIHQQTTALTYTDVSGARTGTVTISGTGFSYPYIGLVVNAVGAGQKKLNFARWKIFGTRLLVSCVVCVYVCVCV